MTQDDAQQLRFAIQKIARRIRANAASEEVTEGQRSVLFALNGAGPLSLRELSEHEGVTPPSMNRTVNALVEAGLVTRTTSQDYARMVKLDLSNEGRTFVDETRRQRDAWFTRQLAALNEEQRRILELAAPVLKELAEQ